MPALGFSLICLAGAVVAGPTPAPRSGSITWLTDGVTLAVANLDTDTVTLVATDPLARLAEIHVGRHPRSVAASRDGKTLLVTLPETSELVWVDLQRRRKTGQLPVPGGPFALVAHPSEDRVYVASTYAHMISEVNVATQEISRQMPVATAPRGLSLSADGQQLYVAHFFTGELSIIDTSKWRCVAQLANRPDANLARSVALAPDERTAYMPHIHANVSNPRLQFDTTVFPVVTKFNLAEEVIVPAGRIGLDAIGRPANNPWDAVVTADGRRLFVVNAGSDDVQVVDLQTGRCLAQIDVGSNPRGIVLAAGGRDAYVHNALSNDLSVIDTVTLEERYRVKLTQDRLPDKILRGKTLFNSARSRSITLDRWISCASCHPDGASDGRTWQFAAGPRKTPSLYGAGLTLPHNRSPDRDEVQDSETFIRQVMAGSGLIAGAEAPPKLGWPSAGRSEDADAVAAYVLSLRPRRSPLASTNAAQLARIQRGRAIFFSERTGCSHCHPPPYFTDSRLASDPWRVHDVGTGDDPAERHGPAFDTPTLLELYTANSYLHDGRAANLAEVFTVYNAEDRHGVTSHLSKDDIECLVAFLLSLPEKDVTQETGTGTLSGQE